jgi:DNA polymerase I-like protein with 3'-5' exonuclease and polymerase domains
LQTQSILFLDVETSTHNKGHYADPRNILVSFATYCQQSGINFKYYRDPDFISSLRADVESADVVVGFNIKFDLHWLLREGIEIKLDQRVWDCQLAEFIYSGQTLAYDSLNAALERYGLPLKHDAVAEYWDQGISTENIPIEVLQEYNIWDVVPSTTELFRIQQELLSDEQKQLVWLEGEDLKTLLAAEHAGMLFDVAGANEKLSRYNNDLATIGSSLAAYLPGAMHELGREYPTCQFNWDSGDHLSAFLYGGKLTFSYAISNTAVYKSGPNKGQSYERNKWHEATVAFDQRFRPLEGTEVAKTKANPNAEVRFYQTDGPTLSQLSARKTEQKHILGLLAERSAKVKVVEMIASVLAKMEEKYWENNLVHAQFNQNVAVTGRLSSSQPNLQNTPPELDELLVSRYG